MLSMHENVNVVCNNENIVCDDENIACNEKASSSMNVSSKCKRYDDAPSAKLWDYRLCHILRGVERLIKEGIVHPFDFSNFKFWNVTKILKLFLNIKNVF
jgi:hypothetical protein